jgi:hypothetical protein
MSTDEKDEDEDVLQALRSDKTSPSASHDEAVLKAARAFANARVSRARRMPPRWLALAAGVAVIGMALWLGWQKRDDEALSFVLSPGMIRSNETVALIELPSASGRVRLDLDLTTVAEQPTYRAELRTRSGKSVWSARDLRPRATEWGRAVSVELDSSVLQPGEYEVMLGEPTDPSYYEFRVQRRN